MVEKSLTDLINRKIDGVLTPEEEVRLGERLATHAEARILLEDLSRQGLLMQNMGEVEPPPSLKPSIMREVQRPALHPGRSWIPDPVARLFESRKRIRYTFAFSGGIVAGMLILAFGLGILRPGALVESDAAGTSMIKSTVSGYRAIEERDVAYGELRGKISTAVDGEGYTITLQIRGPDDTRARLALQPETVHVERIESLDGSTGDYTIRPGGVELRGRMAYRLVLHGAGSVRVTVTSGGKNAYEGDFLLKQ